MMARKAQRGKSAKAGAVLHLREAASIVRAISHLQQAMIMTQALLSFSGIGVPLGIADHAWTMQQTRTETAQKCGMPRAGCHSEAVWGAVAPLRRTHAHALVRCRMLATARAAEGNIMQSLVTEALENISDGCWMVISA